MGIYMGIQQITKIAESLVTQGVKKLKYVTPTYHVGTAEELSLKIEQLVGDKVQISNKSPLGEFISYMKRIELEGKSFRPTFENSNSPIAQYHKYEQAQALKWGGEFKPSLRGYKDFLFDREYTLKGTSIENLIQREIPNITKEEYWQIVDKYCKEIATDVRANPCGLRQEFIDNAEKIQKWAEIFRTQNHYSNVDYKLGKRIELDQYSRFYDEKMYNQAVEEFVNFVEKITGKKVLIGCKSRMNFAVTSLSVLNNPKAYKDFDYILMSHGKGESLLDWSFSDNDKSVWEFIEKNVPKGKQVLTFCCEETMSGGMAHYDSSGILMKAFGQPVSAIASFGQPVKICESGIRHLKGHVSAIEQPKITNLGEVVTQNASMNGIAPVKDVEIVYYNLDFDKFRVENI